MANYTFPKRVDTNASGHEKLGHFYRFLAEHNNCTVHLDWSEVRFMDANMAALFCALTWDMQASNGISYQIDQEIFQGELNVFYRNGLFYHLTESEKNSTAHDDRNSVIPLRKIGLNDADDFVAFVEKDFLGHRGIRNVNYFDKQRIKDSFFEVFSNVSLHARTDKPIFCCGQFYPVKKELKFTLVDLGCGFLKNVEEFTRGKDDHITDGEKAIDWAVRHNSTKTEAAGGTGLYNILKYCYQNNGGLHIVSDQCYWMMENNSVTVKKLHFNFKGTTIHLIFRGK